MTLPDASDDAEPASAPGGRRRSLAKQWILVGGLVALAALVATGVYIDLSRRDTAVTDPLVDRADKPAPPFSLPKLVAPDQTMSLADFKREPLVINFWASWCYPCQAEMPLLESAYRSDHGTVRFLGIDTDDTRQAAISFLVHLRVTYRHCSCPTAARSPPPTA